MKALCTLLCGAILAATSAAQAAEPGPVRKVDRLTIHEWGTFTCLQDEQGRAINGINTDDEALPNFVHRLAHYLSVPPVLPLLYSKGIPRIHPQVTMRLETPVIYFYPPPGHDNSQTLNVRVQFDGGWLSEFYPQARVESPQVDSSGFRFGSLTPESQGRIIWDDLQIGGAGKAPETNFHVWTAPRQVAAARIATPRNESEKYLFYRGVASREAPLQVIRSAEGKSLEIRERFDRTLFAGATPPAVKMWFVSVRPDGLAAWRSLGAVGLTLRHEAPVCTTAATFEQGEYSAERLTELRAEMRHTLLDDGLFDDEAEAMLNTWELGYFRSPGDRLFFLLPHAWTNAVLPLEVSAPADVTRTMIGRIELVTPQHRETLRRLAKATPSKIDWLYKAAEGRPEEDRMALHDIWRGRARFDELGIKPPQDYGHYLDLGRFRNALILDEIRRTKSPELAAFAQTYDIAYYNANED